MLQKKGEGRGSGSVQRKKSNLVTFALLFVVSAFIGFTDKANAVNINLPYSPTDDVIKEEVATVVSDSKVLKMKDRMRKSIMDVQKAERPMKIQMEEKLSPILSEIQMEKMQALMVDQMSEQFAPPEFAPPPPAQ